MSTTGFFAGVDVGRTHNPSALVLLGVTFPDDHGDDLPPVYEVADVRRRRGVKYDDVVEECRSIYRDLERDVTFAVDRVGVGAGLHDMMLNADLPTFGVAMTGGGRQSVAVRNWEMDVPKGFAVEHIVGSALRQGRLLIPRGRGDLLADELSQVSREVTESGSVRYASPSKADGSHGDTFSALAIALVAAWRLGRHWIPERRQVAAMKRQHGAPVERQTARPRGLSKRRGGNGAKRHLDAVMVEKEAAYRMQYAQLWDPGHVLVEIGADDGNDY